MLEEQLMFFEDDFLYRNNRNITSRPDLALTELIANSWDAGATNVNIIIPKILHEIISIEDNGTGMTKEEIKHRWRTLGYNRIKHQGVNVEFPSDVKMNPRIAYGHNGIGRHSMFCFSNNYEIETWKNGIATKCDVVISTGNIPFNLVNFKTYEKDGHGTKISTYLIQNLPNIEESRNILSARYLYDPEFTIKINSEVVELDDHKGLISKEIIKIENITLELYMIDSSVSGKKSIYHGIAFWVSNRLVGKPSWELGTEMIRDGRTRLAKTHTIIVKCNDLIDYVLQDWTGFIESPIIEKMYGEVAEYANKMIRQLCSGKIDETKIDIIRSKREDIETLSPYAQYELSNFVENIVEIQPEISKDSLTSAVNALISIEQAKSGKSLLEKLSRFSEGDIDSLNSLLENWNVNDILKTMDEIDNRILVIEAIQRVCDNKDTDELHTLHPLVAQAKWLFGPEFDSDMFISNKTLRTIVRDILKGKGYREIVDNSRRPDLVLFDESTIAPFYFEDWNDKTSLQEVNKILIIELKKGAFMIGEKEMNQAKSYANALKYSESFTGDYKIVSYVVGGKVDSKMDAIIESQNIIVHACTYNQLVSTAHKRMFSLRKYLKERYDNMETDDIVSKVLKEPGQNKLNI